MKDLEHTLDSGGAMGKVTAGKTAGILLGNWTSRASPLLLGLKSSLPPPSDPNYMAGTLKMASIFASTILTKAYCESQASRRPVLVFSWMPFF